MCGNKVVLVGFNDLATTQPALAAEAQFDPTTVTSGTSRKMPWRCAKGHAWVATVASRTRGAGCPVCSGRKVWSGHNDLATTHPGLALEALFDPTTVTAGSTLKLPWRCTLGHEWMTTPSHRSGQGQGCPTAPIVAFSWDSTTLPLPTLRLWPKPASIRQRSPSAATSRCLGDAATATNGLHPLPAERLLEKGARSAREGRSSRASTTWQPPIRNSQQRPCSMPRPSARVRIGDFPGGARRATSGSPSSSREVHPGRLEAALSARTRPSDLESTTWQQHIRNSLQRPCLTRPR